MIVIRRAAGEDAAAIAHVHVESWRTTYAGIVPDAYLESLDETQRAAHWQELLKDDHEVLVAERDGTIVGFAAAGASCDNVQDCDAELYAIYLQEDAQRSRIGTGLLRELARGLMQRGFSGMNVWVLARNAAKEFYARTGAQYAGAKEIEIGGAVLMEQAYAWPDLAALACIPSTSHS